MMDSKNEGRAMSPELGNLAKRRKHCIIVVDIDHLRNVKFFGRLIDS